MKTVLRNILRIAVAASTFAATSTASAQLVTSVGSLNTPTSTITSFGPGGSYSNGYSANIGGPANVTMSYTGNYGLYINWTGGWGLGDNGYTYNVPAGINQAGILRFTFGNGLIGGVGLMMNYAPQYYGPVYIRALDASNNVLAQYELNASAPITSSANAFRGIQFTGNTIASFELEGQGNPSPIIESLTYTTTSTTVPEPSTGALMAVGFVAIAGFARRRAR